MREGGSERLSCSDSSYVSRIFVCECSRFRSEKEKSSFSKCRMYWCCNSLLMMMRWVPPIYLQHRSSASPPLPPSLPTTNFLLSSKQLARHVQESIVIIILIVILIIATFVGVLTISCPSTPASIPQSRFSLLPTPFFSFRGNCLL